MGVGEGGGGQLSHLCCSTSTHGAFCNLCSGYISELRNTYQSSQIPVTDDETILHKFCVKLETVLRHEQKGRYLSVVLPNRWMIKSWFSLVTESKLESEL